ncbi:GNAT family N-acetyltransferase [Bacillus manliponensis]|uniref:GNAT family N-acetyltransferase n=1 Tax=Bacillus manliponensis TaxID=574376 RepID=UPI00068DD895|nr:GNAT family N-acetyltransferase [Bacillus manliponensis]
MRGISLVNQTFYTLNGSPNYITFEEYDSEVMYIDSDIEIVMNHMIHKANTYGVKYLNICLNQNAPHYTSFSRLLIKNNFKKQSTTLQVKRALTNIKEPPTVPFSLKGLNTISEKEFKHIWKFSMEGSLNTPSQLSIDEQLDAVKTELGLHWEDSCIAVYKDNQPTGVVMPHIEPGTTNEGRLFYFGLVPEMRGKGLSQPLHYYALYLLKGMGATYYIGSTNIVNTPMIHTFQKNKCAVHRKTDRYCLEMYE